MASDGTPSAATPGAAASTAIAAAARPELTSAWLNCQCSRSNPAGFDILTSQNRYAVVFRIEGAKRPETRARRIDEFVSMLARG
ncbi:MAG: YdeI/OmpD-associated family protein, partial [Sporichthyaceae bacterium]|nr:YdeI/OmpD-associated family protein [Sporichthyaceae bacterium]